MKNTWTELTEARNVDDRINSEESTLQYYYLTDKDKFSNRIKEIAKATLDELWIFSQGKYCEHMMYWKKFVESSLGKIILNRLSIEEVLPAIAEGNLFRLTMLKIVDEIEFYHNIYTELFKNGTIWVDGWPAVKCSCEVCS